MKRDRGGFNLFLGLAALLAALAAGCRSPEQPKALGLMRLHLEVKPDATGRSTTVPIFRASPMMVNVEKSPFLDHQSLVQATLLEVEGGGYALMLQFNSHGRNMLEAVSTEFRGRRVAVFTSADDSRWLGAPLLKQRITNGVFAFTPDATREETTRIVEALNRTAKKLKTKDPF